MLINVTSSWGISKLENIIFFPLLTNKQWIFLPVIVVVQGEYFWYRKDLSLLNNFILKRYLKLSLWLILSRLVLKAELEMSNKFQWCQKWETFTTHHLRSRLFSLICYNNHVDRCLMFLIDLAMTKISRMKSSPGVYIIHRRCLHQRCFNTLEEKLCAKY